MLHLQIAKGDVYMQNYKNTKKIIALLVQCILLITLMVNVSHATPNISIINAPHAILMDATTGQILYEEAAYEKAYPASITKLLTALLTVENLEATDILTLSRNSVFSLPLGSSHIGLREDEAITIDQALHGLMLNSANEVAIGLAEKISGSTENFALKMNQRAKELGTTDSNFTNPHGLHDESHYTTAYDMALITKEVIKNPYFLTIMKDITYQIPPTNKVDEIRYLSQRHKLLNSKKDITLYRKDAIAGKTGYTTEAKNTLVTVAKRGNQTLIAVVMEEESGNVYTDTNKLLDYGFKYFKNITLDTNAYTTTLPIMDEEDVIGEATVSLDFSHDVSIRSNKDETSISYEEQLPLSVSKNTQANTSIGSVAIYSDKQLLKETALVVKTLDLDESIATMSERSTLFTLPPTIIYVGLGAGLFLLVFAGFLLFQASRRSKRRYRHRRRSQLVKYKNYR